MFNDVSCAIQGNFIMVMTMVLTKKTSNSSAGLVLSVLVGLVDSHVCPATQPINTQGFYFLGKQVILTLVKGQAVSGVDFCMVLVVALYDHRE